MADFFDMINTKEDRRIRKTKKALRQSLFKLLEEKNINQITVTELAADADINRSTFYIYYDDVYDMMDKIQEEIYNVLLKTLVLFSGNFNDADDLTCYCEKFLEFCKDNYDLCRFVLRNDGNNQLAERLKQAVRNVIPDSAKHFNKLEPRYYLTTFAISGILSVVLDWLDDGMCVPPSDMAKFLASTYTFGSKFQKESDFYKNYSFYQK